MKYALAFAAVLIACCALLLRGGSPAGEPRPAVVEGAPTPLVMPTVSAGTAVSDQKGSPGTAVLEDARQLYTAMRAEPRDAAWANQSEAFIKAMLAGNPNLGPNAPVEVRCASTLCEATGVAAAGAQPDAVERSWDSLRGTADTPLIAAHGLRYVTATFGSGHSIHAFTLYYRREAD